jgi:hypothetical protein
MYMFEGGSRWNLNRARECVDAPETTRTFVYDMRLLSNLNTISERVIGKKLLPEYPLAGQATSEYPLNVPGLS